MEGLPLMGLIQADIGVGAGQPEIAHMTKQMAGRVLRAGIAKMRAQPDEGQRHITLRPVPDRHAGEQKETSTMQQLVAQLREAGPERGQGEIGGGERCRAGLTAACAITLVSPISLPGQPGIERDPDLAVIGFAERKRPVLRARKHLRAVPGAGQILLRRQLGRCHAANTGSIGATHG